MGVGELAAERSQYWGTPCEAIFDEGFFWDFTQKKTGPNISSRASEMLGDP